MQNPYLSISISFSSSCFWRAITPSMMARSSLVRWLRSGSPGGIRGTGPPASSFVSAIGSTLSLGKWKTGDILAGVRLTHGNSSSTHSSSRCGWPASTATAATLRKQQCRTRDQERVLRLELHPRKGVERETWSPHSVYLGCCEDRLRHCMPGIEIAEAVVAIANVAARSFSCSVSFVGARQCFGAGHLGH